MQPILRFQIGLRMERYLSQGEYTIVNYTRTELEMNDN